MFARLSVVQVSIENVNRAIKIYKESVIPAAKSQKGFCEALLLTDRKTGKGIGLTLWENEEDAITNEQSGYYQEQLNKYKDIMTAPPVREGYEVSVQV